MAGKGGGAWKVAYADFATAMMAFFLVMWITGQSKPVKQAVAKYFEDPLGINKGSRSTSLKGPEDSITIGPYESGRGPSRGMAMANLKSSAPPNPRGVSATKPPRMIIFHNADSRRSLGTALLFPDGSAQLDEESQKRLDALIPQLLGKLNKIEIRAFLSRRPLQPESAFQDAWQLCYSRCQTTMEYLTTRGVDAERIRLSLDGEPEPHVPSEKAGTHSDHSNVQVFATDSLVHR